MLTNEQQNNEVLSEIIHCLDAEDAVNRELLDAYEKGDAAEIRRLRQKKKDIQSCVNKLRMFYYKGDFT